jgi:indolepyruvate ferredoxin oxidoreductase
MLQGTPGVDHESLAAAVRGAVGTDRTVLADTTRVAERAFGSHMPANVVLLGIASQLGALPVPALAVEHAIATEGPAPDTNLEAFRWGRWMVADPGAVEAALGGTPEADEADGGGGGGGGGGRGRGRGRGQKATWDPTPGAASRAEQLVDARSLPAALRGLLVRRAAQVIDYQGPALADRWLDLVARAAAVDDETRGWALTTAVAEGWFQVLTYKDKYEVARLHLRLELDAVADELGIAGDFRVRYHLLPPALRRLGRVRKVAVPGGAARAASRGLAAMRRVRGTPFDLFGRAPHRREERRLADDYQAVVAVAIDDLTSDTYAAAVSVAEGIAAVRGYEEIKSGAIARWQAGVRIP